MTTCVNVNGRISGAEQAAIPVFDHGFLYGEGVYETLRTYDHQPFLFERHLQRLRDSAHMLLLDVPFSDAEILERCLDTMTAAGLRAPSAQEAYIRILLTRGVGDLTYDPAATPVPSLVVIVKPLPATPLRDYEQGVTVVMVDRIRNHPDSVSPLIKSNNLLNNALAMQQALRGGGVEAVLCNYRGELSECSQSNLFVVKDGVARTPPLDAGLLAGITRGVIFELGLDTGILVEESTLRPEDLLTADEAFFTSTTKEVMPIARVDDRRIGAGAPGPVTRRFLRAYRDKTGQAPGAPSKGALGEAGPGTARRGP